MRKHAHGQFMGSFCIQTKKKGAGKGVGDQWHGEIIQQLLFDSLP
jgi:hypothetical protein